MYWVETRISYCITAHRHGLHPHHPLQQRYSFELPTAGSPICLWTQAVILLARSEGVGSSSLCTSCSIPYTSADLPLAEQRQPSLSRSATAKETHGVDFHLFILCSCILTESLGSSRITNGIITPVPDQQWELLGPSRPSCGSIERHSSIEHIGDST